MPAYFRVSPKIWNEPWNDSTKLLAFYLLTCRHRTTEGLFRLPRPYVVVDLGWGKRKIETALRELAAVDFIRTHDDVVLIVKALKYQAPHNPNQMKAAISALYSVPPTPLDTDFASLVEAFAPTFRQPLAEAFPQRFAHTPSPALALAPTPSPSPTLDDDDEQLRILLKGKGYEDPEIDLALNRLRLRRAGYGKPITDEAAWVIAVAKKLTRERTESESKEPAVAEINGERLRFVNGQWVREEGMA